MTRLVGMSSTKRMYLVSMDANPFDPKIDTYVVGGPAQGLSLESIFDDLVRMVTERNPDFFDYVNGKIRKAQ